MISYPLYLALLSDVLDCGSIDEYIAECGGSVPVDDAVEAIRILNAIWCMASDGLSIKSIASTCCLPVRQLAIMLDLPQRTVEDWASGKRTPPSWQLPLIAYAALSLSK